MRKMGDPGCDNQNVSPTPAQQAQATRIAAEIASLARTGFALPGTLADRMTRCGHANCRCHADPPRLHGPYWQWTRKVAAKTICRWLSADQHRDYQAWIDNDRRLRDLLARLEALGAAALEADPRWQRKPPPAPRNTGQTST
jgi:hypothetical protein